MNVTARSEEEPLTVERVDCGVTVLSLHGEHDSASAEHLRDTLSSLLASGTGLIVDLTETRFVDCMTMHVLADGQEVAARRGAKVCFQLATTPIVQRIFDTLGASERWPIHRTREGAVAAVRAGG